MDRLELAEGESRRSLWLHPSHHLRRYELRTKTSAVPAPQPFLIGPLSSHSLCPESHLRFDLYLSSHPFVSLNLGFSIRFCLLP
ncbi:hypothetical protein LINGRAHAP2_LOCUS5938 [Linum grandiflorum]